jgi:hypothetical protein
MATGKLVGHDDGTPDGLTNGSNYIVTSKFTAVSTGTMTEFRVKCLSAGNVKCALYADSGGEPGALLGESSSTPVVAGWNTIAFPETLIVSGTAYWPATNSDAQVVGREAETSVRRYKAWTYADAFPNPAGSGYSSDTGRLDFYAGWGIKVLSPSSIGQPVGYGSPQLNLSIQPSSIVQAIVYGTPSVATAALIIYPTSIAQVVAIGIPTLIYPQTLSPQGITQAIVFGTPSVGVVGRLVPQSIIQQISIGSPTLLKYVWHVILDGQYITESPNINRAYIIGRDAYGNPVYGEAHDSAESSLLGERLDFTQELAIPTTAQAGDVASAILAKMRLTGKGGVILIPPNCGQELFDVVQVSDSMANQAAVTFRVVGIRFEYNPKQARYYHKLILGAP